MVPQLRQTQILPGCYWTQQERSKDVSDALLTFLRGL